jgi:micrococcal nuclease
MRVIIPVIIFVFAVILFFVWQVTAGATATQEVLVTKVIDGDTFIIEGGEHVRMLGMDTDEKGYPCYDDAKLALEGMILNRRVVLETDLENKDQYGRLLRWVWLNDTLVNFEMVKEGLAVARFDSDVNYREEIRAAEQAAIANNVGCKWSSLE